MERFSRIVDVHDGVLFTGKSIDPVDKAKDNFEPGIYPFVDVAQTDRHAGPRLILMGRSIESLMLDSRTWLRDFPTFFTASSPAVTTANRTINLGAPERAARGLHVWATNGTATVEGALDTSVSRPGSPTYSTSATGCCASPSRRRAASLPVRTSTSRATTSTGSPTKT